MGSVGYERDIGEIPEGYEWYRGSEAGSASPNGKATGLKCGSFEPEEGVGD